MPLNILCTLSMTLTSILICDLSIGSNIIGPFYHHISGIIGRPVFVIAILQCSVIECKFYFLMMTLDAVQCFILKYIPSIPAQPSRKCNTCLTSQSRLCTSCISSLLYLDIWHFMVSPKNVCVTILFVNDIGKTGKTVSISPILLVWARYKAHRNSLTQWH